MNTPFGEVFLFLTDLAWKSRLTIPVLVTTVFLIMDIRLQIEINIQSGQVDGGDDAHLDDSDDDLLDNDDDLDEYTTDSSDDEDNNDIVYVEVNRTLNSVRADVEDMNATSRLRRSLGLS